MDKKHACWISKVSTFDSHVQQQSCNESQQTHKKK